MEPIVEKDTAAQEDLVFSKLIDIVSGRGSEKRIVSE